MNRTLNLLNAFGFQGGTVHQISEMTGCDINSLLYDLLLEYNEDATNGWFAYRTNSQEFNQTKIAAKNQGNVQFWLGVAQAVESTRKLEQEITAKF